VKQVENSVDVITIFNKYFSVFKFWSSKCAEKFGEKFWQVKYSFSPPLFNGADHQFDSVSCHERDSHQCSWILYPWSMGFIDSFYLTELKNNHSSNFIAETVVPTSFHLQ
jgi:hypothetical protein